MAGFWVRRPRGARELDVDDAELAKRAGLALVAADERLRVAAEELGFAEAELADAATQRLRESLVASRGVLSDAFRLQRLAHGATAGAAGEVRARFARIVELCEGIEGALDAQSSALAERIARARRAPEIIDGIRGDAARLRARIPHARSTVERLAARYAREALVDVETSPAEAEQLLDLAEHSAGVAERRRAAGRLEQGDVALEASVASIRRAAALLDAVEDLEVEALRAEATLALVVEEARGDLAAALSEPVSRDVATATAIADLQAALAALPAVGVNTDPVAHLARVRAARAALDVAIEAARERATHPLPPVVHVHRAIQDADRQLDIARDAIAGHPGWVGAEAMALLAQSEHLRIDLGHYLGSSAAAAMAGGSGAARGNGSGRSAAPGTATITVTDLAHRERVIAMAQRAASLATESLLLARRDIDAIRSKGSGEPRGILGRR
jgi:exonuclease VII small subunit